MNNFFDDPENQKPDFVNATEINTNPATSEVELRPRFYSAIISYIFFFFIVNTIISLVMLRIYEGISGMSYDDVLLDFEAIGDSYYFVAAWTQLGVYLLATICIYFTLKRSFNNDFKRFWQQGKKCLITIGIGWIALIAASYIGNIIVSLAGVTEESGNQQAIEELMSGQYAWIMIITTVILAPILEELIFRKAIFGLLKRRYSQSPVIMIIISALFFGAIHVITPILDAITTGAGGQVIFSEFLYLFYYGLMGAALSYTYYKADYNIFPPIIVHAINNLISVLLLLLM